MRRSIQVLAVVLLSGAACDGSTPARTLAPVEVITPSLAAIRDVLHYEFPIQNTITNSCSGEDVAISGRYSYDARSVITPSGAYRFHVTSWGQGEGVGLTSGRSYRFQSIAPTTVAFVGGYESTLVENLRLVSSGNDDNFILHVLMHQKWAADGSLVVRVVKVDLDCRG